MGVKVGPLEFGLIRKQEVGVLPEFSLFRRTLGSHGRRTSTRMHLALHAGVTLLVKRIVPKHDADIIRVGMLKFQQGVSGSGTLRAAEVNELVNGEHGVRGTLNVPFRATQHDGGLVVIIAHKTHVHLCWRRCEIFLKGGDVGGVLCLGQPDAKQHDGKAKCGVSQPRPGHRMVCPPLHDGTDEEAQVHQI